MSTILAIKVNEKRGKRLAFWGPKSKRVRWASGGCLDIQKEEQAGHYFSREENKRQRLAIILWEKREPMRGNSRTKKEKKRGKGWQLENKEKREERVNRKGKWRREKIIFLGLYLLFLFCVSSHILILMEERRCIRDTMSRINILVSFIILNEFILSNFNYV